MMSKGPVRLAKKEPKNDVYSFFNNQRSIIERWVLSHPTLCITLVICLLMALFVTLIFVMTGVSATDSGITYNQLEKII